MSEEVDINAADFIRDYIDLEEQTQPNGVELTLAWVERFLEAGKLAFDNSERVLPRTERLEFDPEGWIWLPHGSYKIGFNELVTIPEDRFAIARPRSSLLRMGVSVGTALWDSGFRGKGEAMLCVHNPHGFWVRKDARIVQLVFFKLPTRAHKLYEGQYKDRTW